MPKRRKIIKKEESSKETNCVAEVKVEHDAEVKKEPDDDQEEDNVREKTFTRRNLRPRKNTKLEPVKKSADCADADTPRRSARPIVKRRVFKRRKNGKAGKVATTSDTTSTAEVTSSTAEEVTTSITEATVSAPTSTAEAEATASATTCAAEATVEKEPKTEIEAANPLPPMEVAPPPPPPPPTRKQFFRGRKSKSLSASKSGRVEIIHTEEEMKPEDLRGFEHVERYVTPPGVRLPKFWDSEDELSDDETSDNYRRIMCGFGTNCRIHEVIRPASEIVRRLKELQNSFGTSKTLPLFPKVHPEPELPAGTMEQDLREEHSIRWHNDPWYFNFVNNFP